MSDLEKCWEDDEETAPPRVEIIPSKAAQRVAKQESKPRAAPSVAAPVAVAPPMEEKAKPETAALLQNTLQMIQRQNTLIERYEKMLEKMERPSEKRPLPTTPDAEIAPKNVNEYITPPPRKKTVAATGYLATAPRPPLWSAPLQRNPTNSAPPNMARKNYLELKKKLYKY